MQNRSFFRSWISILLVIAVILLLAGLSLSPSRSPTLFVLTWCTEALVLFLLILVGLGEILTVYFGYTYLKKDVSRLKEEIDTIDPEDQGP